MKPISLDEYLIAGEEFWPKYWYVAKELGETMTDEELQEMVDRADSNGDGAVSMDDFYNIMTKKTFA